MMTYLKSIGEIQEYGRCSALGASAYNDQGCVTLFTKIKTNARSFTS